MSKNNTYNSRFGSPIMPDDWSDLKGLTSGNNSNSNATDQRIDALDSNMNFLRKTVEGTIDHLGDVCDDVKALEAENVLIHRDIQEIKSKLDDLDVNDKPVDGSTIIIVDDSSFKEVIDNVSVRVNNNSVEIEKLANKINSISTDSSVLVSAVNDKVEEIEDNLRNTAISIINTNTKIDNFEKTLDKTTQDVSDLRNYVDELKETYVEEKAELVNDISAVKSDVENVSVAVDAISEVLDSFVSLAEGMQNTVDTLKADSSNNSADIDSIKNEINVIKDEYAAHLNNTSTHVDRSELDEYVKTNDAKWYVDTELAKVTGSIEANHKAIEAGINANHDAIEELQKELAINYHEDERLSKELESLRLDTSNRLSPEDLSDYIKAEEAKSYVDEKLVEQKQELTNYIDGAIDDVENDLDKLVQDISTTNSLYEDEFSKLNASINDINSSVDSVNAEIITIKELIGTITGDASISNNVITELKNEIKEELSNVNASINSIKDDVKDIEGDIKDVLVDVGVNKAKIKEVEEEVEERFDNVDSSVKNIIADIENVEASIDSIVADASLAEQNFNDFKAEVEEQLVNVDASINGINEQISEVSANIDAVKTDVEALTQTVADNKEEVLAKFEDYATTEYVDTNIKVEHDYTSGEFTKIWSKFESLDDYDNLFEENLNKKIEEISTNVSANASEIKTIKEAVDAILADTSVADSIDSLKEQFEQYVVTNDASVDDISNRLALEIKNIKEAVEGILADTSVADSVDSLKEQFEQYVVTNDASVDDISNRLADFINDASSKFITSDDLNFDNLATTEYVDSQLNAVRRDVGATADVLRAEFKDEAEKHATKEELEEYQKKCDLEAWKDGLLSGIGETAKTEATHVAIHVAKKEIEKALGNLNASTLDKIQDVVDMLENSSIGEVLEVVDDVKDLSNNIDDLNKQLSDVSSNVKDVNDKVDNISNNITNVSDNLDKLAERVDKLEQNDYVAADDISSFVTKDELDEALKNIGDVDLSDLLTKTEAQELYVDLNTYNKHLIDVSNKADKSYVDDEINKAIEGIQTKLDASYNELTDYIDNVSTVLNSSIDELYNYIDASVNEIYNYIDTSVADVVTNTIETVVNDKIETIVKEQLDNVVTEKVESVVETVVADVSKIVMDVSNMKADKVELKDEVNKIDTSIQYLTEYIHTLETKLQEVDNTVIEFLDDDSSIHNCDAAKAANLFSVKREPVDHIAVSVVGGDLTETVYIQAFNRVQLTNVSIYGEKEANYNGKINIDSPACSIVNNIVTPEANMYNVYELSQKTKSTAVTLSKTTVDANAIHNVLNVYNVVDNAEILVKDSSFNLDVATSNILRVSNLSNATNVTVLFDNVNWTYENKSKENADWTAAGAVIYQPFSTDNGYNTNFDAMKTWSFVFRNCKYNGEAITAANWGEHNQVMCNYNIQNNKLYTNPLDAGFNITVE